MRRKIARVADQRDVCKDSLQPGDRALKSVLEEEGSAAYGGCEQGSSNVKFELPCSLRVSDNLSAPLQSFFR